MSSPRGLVLDQGDSFNFAEGREVLLEFFLVGVIGEIGDVDIVGNL
jgi:hypothetical protein